MIKFIKDTLKGLIADYKVLFHKKKCRQAEEIMIQDMKNRMNPKVREIFDYNKEVS